MTLSLILMVIAASQFHSLSLCLLMTVTHKLLDIFFSHFWTGLESFVGRSAKSGMLAQSFVWRFESAMEIRRPLLVSRLVISLLNFVSRWRELEALESCALEGTVTEFYSHLSH